MSGSSSFNEKDLDWQVQDQQAAAENPKQYEPIVSEPDETARVKKDLEANGEKHSTRGPLSRLQSVKYIFN